jgi:D-beta-D-heptose 7-phosphate kinase/D-beta-D-heptose 1-phosphate adenosyltransferase
VLAAKGSEERLGGAGNVAANLVAMQAEVDIIGVVGSDEPGRIMLELFAKLGVDTEGCIVDAARPTIQKTRMMSAGHQLLRVDSEDVSPVTGTALQEVLSVLAERIRRARAVIVSDYGKGLLTDDVLVATIKNARAAGVPVLVDPKGHDYRRYSGATLVTPNRREAEQALGRKLDNFEELPKAADELLRIAQLDAAVITLGPDGMFFKSRDGDQGQVPALARAVFDVTGAGDTVVAQLGLWLANGQSLECAVELANHAAAIVVTRLGTHAVTRGELRAVFHEGPREENKIVSEADLERLLAAWRKEGRHIVFTNGCFDVLHAGHVQYLRYARSRGDVLLVGVNDDESVKRLKGNERPVNTLEDRMAVLAALEMVDAVVSFSEDTPVNIIQRVTPHILVKGQDWADKGVVGREWVEAHGGQVVLAPVLPGRSTTSILSKVRRAPRQ